MASACQHYIQLPHIPKKLTIIFMLCTIILQVTCTSFTPSDTLAEHERTCSGQTTLAELGCTNPPRDSCLFYANCLEARYRCGPTGYPIGFGAKFCQKFSTDRAQLSARGQTWMLDTMQCLQRALVPEATGTKPGVTCDSLKKTAFGTHAGCYVGSGLCKLSPSDWAAVVDIVQLKTLFENWDALLSVLEVGEECLGFYTFLVTGAL